MKSRTSFFNATVLWKNITRFAPAWGLYLLGTLLIFQGGFFRENGYDLAAVADRSIGLWGLLNFCYAPVCAGLLFGDLFNSRLCNALHAMPLRRESWYVLHLVSGLLFSLVPNLVLAVSMLFRLGEYWFVAIAWLGGVSLSYLFFFGAAVISAQCTGNRFAMVLVYGLINFLSVLFLGLLQSLYEPLLYGVSINPDGFVLLSPVSYLCSTELNFANIPGKGVAVSAQNGWPYLVSIALVGTVMLAAALLLYRRRQLECAGDFIAFRRLGPVFHVLYTQVAGMALYVFALLFGLEQGYLFLAVGIAAGFFTGLMLLKRTVRVFQPAAFAGLAVTFLVIFGSMGLVKLDVFGVVNWMPERGSVKSVTVGWPYGDAGYTAEEDEQIRDLMAIHQQLLEDQRDQDGPRTLISLRYDLTDGRTVTRQYDLVYNGSTAKELAWYFSQPEYLFHTEDVPALVESVKYVYLHSSITGETVADLQGADCRSFLEALLADCEAGLTAQDWYYYEDSELIAWVDIVLPNAGSIGMNLRNTFVNTVAWLNAHGVDLQT